MKPLIAIILLFSLNKSYCQLIHYIFNNCDTPVYFNHGTLYCNEADRIVYDSMPIQVISLNDTITEYKVIILRGNRGNAILKHYYENGQLYCCLNYIESSNVSIDTINASINDSSYIEYRVSYHALLDGPITFWYKNGNKKCDQFYSKGYQTGIERTYFFNGNLKSEGHKEQKNEYFSYKTGNWLFFDFTGNKIKEINFTDGDSIGHYNEYYPSGSLKVEGKHSYGKGKCNIYITNPLTLEEELIIKECDSAIVKDGIWNFYNLQGQIIKTEKYHKGEKIK